MRLKIKLPKLKCLRCNYNWIPRKKDITLCPSCKSPYWNKPRINKRKKLKK